MGQNTSKMLQNLPFAQPAYLSAQSQKLVMQSFGRWTDLINLCSGISNSGLSLSSSGACPQHWDVCLPGYPHSSGHAAGPSHCQAPEQGATSTQGQMLLIKLKSSFTRRKPLFQFQIPPGFLLGVTVLLSPLALDKCRIQETLKLKTAWS